MRTLLSAMCMLASIAACSSNAAQRTPQSTAPPSATATSSQPSPGASVSPAPTAQPTLILGHSVRADDVKLSDDRMILRVDFVGGPTYERDNPCFVDYTYYTNEVGEVLELGITELHAPAPTRPPPPEPEVECPAVGELRHADLDLDRPFDGTTVKNGSETFYVAEPAGLVELAGVPEGWSLAAAEDVPGGSVGRWQRSWSKTLGCPISPIRGGSTSFRRSVHVSTLPAARVARPCRSMERMRRSGSGHRPASSCWSGNWVGSASHWSPTKLTSRSMSWRLSPSPPTYPISPSSPNGRSGYPH